MFQRIVERMTKELTDTIRDASLSLRPAIRGGELDRGREKRAQATAGSKKVVGAGVPAPLHEERVIARARRQICTSSSTSETPMMNAALILENARLPVIGLDFHSSS